jgi:hypothetical protein
MNMHILSDQQFQQIATALEQAFVAINACQHIELDMTKPAVAPVAKPTQTTESQSKTRGSSRKGRRGMQALNAKKALDIKRQLAAGVSATQLARQYGVHVTTINCIKTGKTWKHVSLQQDQPTTVVI